MSRSAQKTTKNSTPATKAGGKVTISLRINPAHLQRVQELAARKGVVPSAIIQMAVAEYLECEEK